MGPPKDYAKERRQSKEPTRIQRILDSLVVSALMGGIAFGVSVHSRGVDNSHQINRVESDVKRIERDQKEFKKIVYRRFKEFDDRFHEAEKQIWQRKVEKP